MWRGRVTLCPACGEEVCFRASKNSRRILKRICFGFALRAIDAAQIPIQRNQDQMLALRPLLTYLPRTLELWVKNRQKSSKILKACLVDTGRSRRLVKKTTRLGFICEDSLHGLRENIVDCRIRQLSFLEGSDSGPTEGKVQRVRGSVVLGVACVALSAIWPGPATASSTTTKPQQRFAPAVEILQQRTAETMPPWERR